MTDAGRPAEAISSLRRALQKDPRDAEAMNYLSWLLYQSGEPVQAEYYARQAIKRVPTEARYHRALAHALQARNDYAGAEMACRDAIAADPSNWQAHLDLGNTLMALKRPAECDEAYANAMRIAPGQVSPVVNRSTILNDLGRPEDALAILRDVRTRHPADIRVQSAICSKLAYLDSVSPEESLAEHRRYGELVGTGAPMTKPSWKPGERPLRVGFVSPDLHLHSVTFFLEPILEHHDRSRVAIYCYDTHGIPDAVTERLKKYATGWRNAPNPQPQVLEALVQADALDVLIDLAGHTNGHRLHVMARRLAPVQATFLGYPNTTGVPAIDWRIVDQHTDPAGSEALITERIARIENCMLCYRPPEGCPGVALPPSAHGEPFTFGSCNMAAKTSDTCVRLWAACLKAVPGSRMLIKNSSYAIESVKRALIERFTREGVGADRLIFAGHTPSLVAHLETYARIDVALDSFPYHGTTTTCDTLWMGPPVVTLAGKTHASRVGVSLLNTVGLGELVAKSESEFARIAAGLASDPARLATLRAGMRDRLRTSPLLDAPGYAGRFQAVLESICQ